MLLVETVGPLILRQEVIPDKAAGASQSKELPGCCPGIRQQPIADVAVAVQICHDEPVMVERLRAATL